MELISATHELLTNHGFLDHTLWFSLRSDINKELRQFDASIPRIMSVKDIAATVILHHLFLLPFLPLQDSVMGLAISPNPRTIPWMPKIPDGVNDLLVATIDALLAVPELVARLEARGVPTLLLGVNDTKALYHAHSLRVHGIITDRPEWARQELRKEFEHAQ